MLGSGAAERWFIQGSVDGVALPRRFELKAFPFRIGRRDGLDVVLPVVHVSGVHAEIIERDRQLWIRDLGSSNGTRLNRAPVADRAPLDDGDVLQFANLQFVVERGEDAATRLHEGAQLETVDPKLAYADSLQQLIRERQVASVFQPITRFDDPSEASYELLGRGNRDGFVRAPNPLFQIAEAAGLAPDLSALFREVGTRAASTLPGTPRVFINTHPDEVMSASLLHSLQTLRAHLPQLPLTIEVHETCMSDPVRMRELRHRLSELDVRIAYDDIGAGAARLQELALAPPDYLKFHRGVVRGLHSAPESRQLMVERLVRMVKDMGARCLAEGIESPQELEICKQMGFDYGQGYLLGRPQPAAAWSR